MFLDSRLKALAAQKEPLVRRQELGRQLIRLEWKLVLADLRRPLSEVGLGMAVMRRLFGPRRKT